jgi:hypothetical protein
VTNLEQLHAVGAEEEHQLSRIAEALPNAIVSRVPFLAREVCDLEALGEVVPYLDVPMA